MDENRQFLFFVKTEHYDQINAKLKGIIMDRNTKVVVYATYQEIILTPKQTFDALKRKIKQFDPIEQISYCSFLNMICQTCYIDELRNLQYNEFRGLPTIRKIIKGEELVFHRETLLFYISQVIDNDIFGILTSADVFYCQTRLLIILSRSFLKGNS